ncbi:MAG: hypothetical protein WCT19_01240 [Candidatus Paceibacterota bacterium]|jgi:hypothetical protein
MKLKKFIKKLEKIDRESTTSIDVVMADGIPVVSPVYLDDFINKKVVVITDQK